MTSIDFSSRRADRTPRKAMGGGLFVSALTVLALTPAASKASVVAPEVVAPTVVTPKVVTPQAPASAPAPTPAPAPASNSPAPAPASNSPAPASNSRRPPKVLAVPPATPGPSDHEPVVYDDLIPRRTFGEEPSPKQRERIEAVGYLSEAEARVRKVLEQIGFGPKPQAPAPSGPAGAPPVIETPFPDAPSGDLLDEVAALLGALLGKPRADVLAGYDTKKAQ